MKPSRESVELARYCILRVAENIGDPDAGRLLAELADRLAPGPGPSKSRRASKAALARRVRHVWRTNYKGLSALGAAAEMHQAATRYAASLTHRGGVVPLTEPTATWHALLGEGRIPRPRTIREWLSAE